MSGTVSLASKVLLLGVAVALAISGLHQRPFLIFCFPGDSPVLNQTGVRPCKYSEDSCGSSNNLTNEIRTADALSAVKETLLEYQHILNDIRDDDLKTENPHLTDSLNMNLNKASTFLAHIRSSKAEIDETLNNAGIGKVQHKLRICEENETPFRLWVLSGLLVVFALATYATLRLSGIHVKHVYQMKTCRTRILLSWWLERDKHGRQHSLWSSEITSTLSVPQEPGVDSFDIRQYRFPFLSKNKFDQTRFFAAFGRLTIVGVS